MIYRSPTNAPAAIPWSREVAIAEGAPRYMRPDDGTRCGNPVTLKKGKIAPCACVAEYTETGKCVECTSRELWSKVLNENALPRSYDQAVAEGSHYVATPAPCREGPHLRIFDININGEHCAICREEPPRRQAAKDAGRETYTPRTRCKKCKTKSPRSTETGRCVRCESSRVVTLSPRQLAVQAGEAKYMPDTTCEKCFTIALRSVQNGACDGCKAAAKVTKRASPRQLAIRAGETKFMPDTPCPYCHNTALKRVDNGRCDGCNPPKPAKDELNEATRLALDTMPEGQVISIEVAQSCGFDAFRPTGDKWLHIKTLKEV